MPVVLGPVGETDVPVVSWIDAVSAEHVISFGPGVTVWLTTGVQGWWTPESDVILQELAIQPGAAFRTTRDRVRRVDLPLFVESTTLAGARDGLRTLARWFDPNAGDGWLRVDYGDEARQLRARPAGMVADERRYDFTVPRLAVASVLALRPYWQAVEPETATFAPNAGVGSFFPWPPLVLAASNQFSQASIDNPGDVDSWPVWTVTGPAQDLTLTNITTGKQFGLRFEYLLQVGETLTIDTRPGVRTVTDQSGNSIFGYQIQNSELWPLVTGNNDIRIQAGSTDVDTTLVELSYVPEYRTP